MQRLSWPITATIAQAIWFSSLAAGTPAAAQQDQVPAAEMAREVLGIALANIQRAKCGSGFCTPATDAEKAQPQMTDQQAQWIVQTGLLSAFAEHCDVDWQTRSFTPLMRSLRTDIGFTERQMALAGIMHGYMQQRTKEALAKNVKECTDKMRTEIEQRLTPAAPKQ